MAPCSKITSTIILFHYNINHFCTKEIKSDPFDDDMLKDGEKVDNEVQRYLFNKCSGLLVLSQQTEQFSVRYNTRGTY
jgi:hypothetical protein